VIEESGTITSGVGIDLSDDYGLSRSMHLFGIVGNVRGPNVANLICNLSFRDGSSGTDFFKFDVTTGHASNELSSFVFMMEEDSYIRISEGLFVTPTSASAAAFSLLTFTVLYQ